MRNTKSTIPMKLRQQLSEDPEYGYCCVTGIKSSPADPVEWHHNLKWQGKNEQARFCILPILRSIHLKADTREVREKLDWVMWSRATDEEVAYYSKATNYAHKKKMLIEKFGVYVPPTPVAAPAKAAEDKPLWYPIKGDKKTKLEKIRQFHAEREGIKYSNIAVIDQMIDEHYEEVIHLDAEFGDNPKPGTVY